MNDNFFNVVEDTSTNDDVLKFDVQGETFIHDLENAEDMEENKESKLMKKIIHSILEMCQLTSFKDVHLICNHGSVFANSLLLSSLFPIIKETMCSLSSIESEATTISLPGVDVGDMREFLENIYIKERKIKVCKSINDILSQQLRFDAAVHDIRTIQMEDFENTFDADVDANGNDEFRNDDAIKISISKKASTDDVNIAEEYIDSGRGEKGFFGWPSYCTLNMTKGLIDAITSNNIEPTLP